MNPMGPTTYTMVKLEQQHRLARLEHRRRQLDDIADEPKPQHTHRAVPQLTLSRRITIAAATATALLGLVAGAVLAFAG